MIAVADTVRWTNLLETQRLLRHEIARAVPDLACVQDEIERLFRNVAACEEGMQTIIGKITERVSVLDG